MSKSRRWRLPILWLALTLALSAYGVTAFEGDRRAILLPGPTTHGHHQIELSCESCHTESFAERSSFQDACIGCHAEQLREAHDSHPRTKFTDPRNADLLTRLDARECITCHVEHDPQATREMGLTLPNDYCINCHSTIGEERPTHQGLAFVTCADAGCHNFHDNRGLYEDFLRRHADEPALLENQAVLVRTSQPSDQSSSDQSSSDEPQSFIGSAHDRADIGCASCHGAESEGEAAFVREPEHAACAECHEFEVDGFLDGLHGMRLAAELSPMQPRMARLPMRHEAAHRELGCNSCHRAHDYDTEVAARDACLECHSDDHSLAYSSSRHAELWDAELAGTGAPGTGVSCATCHMPRERRGGEVVVVHNQSANLRPNEAMIRSVCASCHGVPFSIDALADSALVRSNFNASPTHHIESISMVMSRE